jgi:hypothetical protein
MTCDTCSSLTYFLSLGRGVNLNGDRLLGVPRSGTLESRHGWLGVWVGGYLKSDEAGMHCLGSARAQPQGRPELEAGHAWRRQPGTGFWVWAKIRQEKRGKGRSNVFFWTRGEGIVTKHVASGYGLPLSPSLMINITDENRRINRHKIGRLFFISLNIGNLQHKAPT